jgi:hypothetical protein
MVLRGGGGKREEDRFVVRESCRGTTLTVASVPMIEKGLRNPWDTIDTLDGGSDHKKKAAWRGLQARAVNGAAARRHGGHVGE